MYEEYFGLTGAPFKLNPDPKFFFGSRSHNKAMAYLHYGLKQAEGFIVITGPVGAGKSTVISHLLDQLTSSNVVAATLMTPNIAREELLAHILSAFQIEPENPGASGELEALEDYLYDQLNRGRRVLLIVDEAQNLPRETLEQLRVLSNMDYEGTPLFQVFLVGQPEFRETIESAAMEQLRQRVSAAYHLEALSLEEVREYIFHRLTVVGWKEDPVFTPDAIEAIYAETGGLPRPINNLCNRLMVYAAMEKLHEIDGAVVARTVNELKEERLLSIMEPAVESVRKSAPGKKPLPRSVAPRTAQPSAQPSGSQASVLDRVRARKADAPSGAPEPETATLNDVASAIAAASKSKPRIFDADHDTAEPGPARKGAKLTPAMIETIRETRSALSEAHEAVGRLKKSMTKMRRRQDETRAEVSASLARAESLLDAIRDVWK